MNIFVCSKFAKVPPEAIDISTVSSSDKWSDLSPFKIGPCKLYDGMIAKNMENAWQFSKLYDKQGHADSEGNPTEKYWTWAKKGWADEWAHRYPMGKGAKPLHSLWKIEDKLQHLPYIEARKVIYGPLYIMGVRKTESYKKLQEMMKEDKDIYFRDWDGYNHDKLGWSLTEVLNCETKKMGHAFFLKASLTNDPVLDLLRFDLHNE